MATAALVAMIVLTLVGVGLWAVWPRPKGWLIDLLGVSRAPVNPAPPDGPSIVVLPFRNASGDPDQEYLSDGITEDLTTELGKSSRYLFVVSSHSAFTYKQRDVSVQEVGKQLGARYVLEGSMSRSGERVRIEARLSEASSGGKLWADSYDRPLSDIFALQSEIVERILVAAGAEVEAAELARLASTPLQNTGAIESIWRGTYHLRQVTRKDLMKARRFFEHAIELEPELAGPYAFLAGTYTQEFSNGWSGDESFLDRAEELTNRAIQNEKPSSAGYAIRGVVHILRNDPKKAIPDEERAIEMEPNVMWPHALRGMALGEEGRWVEGMRSLKTALRLDPKPPPGLKLMLAYINYGAGRRDEAIEVMEEIRANNSDNIIVRVALAAFHQREGRPEVARELVREIKQVVPEMTTEWAMALIPGLENVAGRAEFEKYPQHLRGAGLP